MRFYIDQVLKDAWRTAASARRVRQAQQAHPQAVAAYVSLLEFCLPRNHTVDIVTNRNILYVPIQKVATSRIRRALSEIADKAHVFTHHRTKDRFGNPPTLRDVSPIDVYRILTSPDALRFTFVRNPYERVVSAWASKFKDLPLVKGRRFTRGTPEMDTYLRLRAEIDPALPVGADRTLGFADFVTYATAVAENWYDNHVQIQSNLMDLPGLTLNFIGRLEHYETDIRRLLDHAQASPRLRDKVLVPVNKVARMRYQDYYTYDLAKRISKTYEKDFDRFQYAKELR